MNGASLLIAEDGRVRPIWRFFAGIVVVYVAANLAPLATIPFRNSSFITRELVARGVLTILLAGAFSLLLISLDGVEGSPLTALGLAFRKPALQDSIVGFCFGAAMVTLAVIAIELLGHLAFTIVVTLPAMLKPLVLVTATLAIAAMAEELAFRGYPFQRLIEAIGAVGAVVISASLFASQHIHNPHATLFGVVNTAAVGVLLALAYLKTKALWLPWGIHFGWNLTLGVVFGLPVSGITGFAVITHGTATGPAWLTGGDYGIEASATATGAIIVGIAALAFFCHPRPAVPASPHSAAR